MECDMVRKMTEVIQNGSIDGWILVELQEHQDEVQGRGVDKEKS